MSPKSHESKIPDKAIGNKGLSDGGNAPPSGTLVKSAALQSVINAWPTLSAAEQAKILKIVEANKPPR